MKKQTIWILAAVGLVLFLVTRKKSAAKSPTANSGTAANRDVLSSWFDSIKNRYSSQSPDNTPQLVTAATNAFSGITGALSKLFNGSAGKSAGDASMTIGSGVPYNATDTVISTDLTGDSYNWFDNFSNFDDYLNFDASASYVLA